ncbi:hypothetical protein LTR28_001675 [Elasticomyces elasticus]|nr:hypothetical protein LTR28_001675 [Elasticomyces elasticus]
MASITSVSAPPPPPPQWVLDLNSAPTTKPKTSNFPEPPGYTAPLSAKQSSKSSKAQPTPSRKPPTTAEMDTLKLKKAWELAIAPAKQLPMNAIGMYMTGNSLQIFSIMMVFMLFKTPITAILTMQPTFARFEPGDESKRGSFWLTKIVFIAMNCLALALGIWKVNGMGLLPTTRSDWLAWETAREPLERAYPGPGL